MERVLKSRPLWIEQAAKFGAVGLLNTAVDVGLYFVLTRWIGLGVVFAKTISYGAGILNSFFWNKSWTFQSAASTRTTIFPFFLVNLAGLGINTGVMQVCMNGFHVAETAALGLATVCTLAWNFFLSKFVLFRKKNTQNNEK